MLEEVDLVGPLYKNTPLQALPFFFFFFFFLTLFDMQ